MLAYADDLALVSKPKEDLQSLLSATGKIATWAGLSFNARKCATIHIDGRKRNILTTQFNIQDGSLTVLKECDVYEHLGVPTGYHVAQSAKKVLKKMELNVTKIDASLLAPWQKLDAVNTFVLPAIGFHLKNGVVQKKSLTKLDKQIKAAAKKWLSLLQRAGVEPLYLSYQMGGANLLPINTLADVSQLVHGLRLLKSLDLKNLLLAMLETLVEKRMRRKPMQRELAEYLNGSMDGDFANESTDVTNVWTRLRLASKRLQTKIDVEWTSAADGLQLQMNGFNLLAKNAETALRHAVRDFYRRRLLAKIDQGKVFEVTSITTPSNHFMRYGDFTRFAEWRFIHRARLGCVPLNGTKRFGNGDKRCRRCGYVDETLPHVLCHCKPNFAAITRRHNAILDRIVNAYKAPATSLVRVNQTIPELDGSLRPDFVVLDKTEGTATVIDVTMPFENRFAAFNAARAEKKIKYD